MSRSRTVIATGIWLFANQIVTIFQQIGIVPLFLHFWGDKLYGDWLEISSITFWFGLADGGMQSHVINRLTGLFAREEWPEFRKEQASATLMYAAAVGVGIVFVVVGTLFLPLDAHLREQARPLAGSAASIFALLGSWVLLMVLSGYVTGLYKVAGRADRYGAVSFIQMALQLAVTAAVLVLRGSAMDLAIAYLVVAAVSMAGCLWDTRRLNVILTPTLTGARWDLAVLFIGPSLMFLLLQMGRNLTIQGMTIVVSESLGAVAVVSFTTTRTLAGVLRMVTSVLSWSVWPELTRMSARGEKERFAFAHSIVVKLSTVLSIMGTAMLFAAGTDLYRLWTHRTADPLLMRLFLADALIGTPAFASVVVLQATSHLRQMALIQTAVGIANVAAAWLLVKHWGLPIVVASPIFFTVFVFGTWIPAHVQKFLGQPVSAYWREIYLPSAWISGVSVLLVWLAHPFFKSGVVAIACDSVIAFVVAGLLGYFFLFNRTETDFVATIARRFLRRSGDAPPPAAA